MPADRLSIAVTLTVGQTDHAVPAGNVQSFELDLCGYGFSGYVEFVLADDQALRGPRTDSLLADFQKQDLSSISVSIKSVLSGESDSPSFTALVVKGIVTERSVVETPTLTGGKTSAVVARKYKVRFGDAARVLWGQHRPCALYTNKAFSAVLDDHKGDKIVLAYDWEDELSKERPQIFVGLDRDAGPSFYDFVLSFLDSRGGVLAYDYATAQYKLSATKDATATPLSLKPTDVASVEVAFPEAVRHDITVLNSYATAATTEAVTQENAAQGIREDVLLRSPLADVAEAQVKLAKARLVSRQKELRVEFSRFPTSALLPGMLVKLPAKDAFAMAGISAGETFRVIRIEASGTTLRKGGDDESSAPNAGYDLRLRAVLEPKDEPRVDLPAHARTFPPRQLEGTIVSEVGEDGEETWKAYTDEKTSIDRYQVKVPLFDNQLVFAPFEPGLLPGQFYFPYAKASRVLLSMEMEATHILRSLEWRAGARMPADGEGVQLLMGKTTKSGTAMTHDYADGKPAFQLQRHNDKDEATIRLEEGLLRIQVKEGS
ncbi:MAG TPA: hypothetical protein VGH20_01785 [Myxococcales bacterium]|jgi:hypothetical protein